MLIPQFQKRSFADGQFLGGTLNIFNYRKISKISPSMYKPPMQTRNARNPPLNRPSKYKPPGGLVLGNCPQIQSKTKKNGKFPTKSKASLIDF